MDTTEKTGIAAIATVVLAIAGAFGLGQPMTKSTMITNGKRSKRSLIEQRQMLS